ncbi:26S proteasome non-ATPase regulatory subunit 4 [Tanacetum coccineum]
MEAEATMILMDTSAWMLHHKSNQFLAQAEAIKLYCKEKFDLHPENCVGILPMGGFAQTFVAPTRDLPRIMSSTYGTRADMDINMRILDALKNADRVLENIIRDKKRIVVFFGGLVPCGLKDSLREFGMKLSKKGVAVDVASFGGKNGPKIRVEALVAAANKNCWENRL